MSLDQLKSHPLVVNVYSFILACLGLNHGSYEPIPSNLAPSSTIGVVRVIVQAANVKKRITRPKPFVTMRVQGRAETRSTAGQTKTYSPNWLLESSYLLIYSLDEKLEFTVLNHHKFFRPGTIGKTFVPLTILEDGTTCTGKEANIIKSGHKLRGSLLFDLFYYPISPQRNIAYYTINVGVVTLRIGQAKSLTWDEYERKPSTSLVVLTSLGWTSNPIHQSEKAYRFDNPSWDCIFDFLCFDKATTTVVVKLVPKVKKSAVQVVYGHISLALNDLIEARDEKREWWPLSGFPNGQIQVTAEWKPIDMNHSNICT